MPFPRWKHSITQCKILPLSSPCFMENTRRNWAPIGLGSWVTRRSRIFCWSVCDVWHKQDTNITTHWDVGIVYCSHRTWRSAPWGQELCHLSLCLYSAYSKQRRIKILCLNFYFWFFLVHEVWFQIFLICSISLPKHNFCSILAFLWFLKYTNWNV